MTSPRRWSTQDSPYSQSENNHTRYIKRSFILGLSKWTGRHDGKYMVCLDLPARLGFSNVVDRTTFCLPRSCIIRLMGVHCFARATAWALRSKQAALSDYCVIFVLPNYVCGCGCGCCGNSYNRNRSSIGRKQRSSLTRLPACFSKPKQRLEQNITHPSDG